MDDKLKRIFNACNPNLAAGEDYYTDCKEARGGELLAGKVIKRLRFIENTYLRFLFTGHIGSGKSSELVHLSGKLKEETNFLPVYVDVANYINFENVTFDEIWLAIAVEIADVFQNDLKIKLKNNYFEDKLAEVKDIFLTKRKITKIDTNVFGLGKAEIQEIKQNDEARNKLYEAIGEDNKSLLDELNLFVKEATLKLLKTDSQYTNIVIIVDSLEKIQKFEEKPQGIESQKELFIEQYTKLTGIESHIIYTVPLALCRSDQRPKLAQYYAEPLVLPMVKIFHRGNFNREYEKGCEAFIKVLTKRLKDISLTEAFDADALKYLIKYSGGNLRNLMLFIQEAIISTEDLPVSHDTARKSVQPTVRSYASSIREGNWVKLAELEKSSDQQIDNGDEAFWTMLENLTVMEYVNGSDTKEQDDNWYAVNPAVRETLKFKAALKEISQTS